MTRSEKVSFWLYRWINRLYKEQIKSLLFFVWPYPFKKLAIFEYWEQAEGATYKGAE